MVGVLAEGGVDRVLRRSRKRSEPIRSGASRSLADAEVAKYPSPPGNREAPVETADDGRQVVGVDLHRRRSVLVQMT